MKCVAIILLLSFGPLLGQEAPNDGEQTIDQLIKSVKEMTHNLKDEASDSLLVYAVLKLGERLSSEKDEVKKAEARSAIKEAVEALNKKSTGRLAEFIDNTRPLTAMLFSQQQRNSYEVIKNPSDQSQGIISQNQAGDTAGVLVAAEAPFFFPDYPNRSVMPIGAWFGVHLQTGGGVDIGGVDYAAGLSLSYISGRSIGKLKSESDLSPLDSGRLLLGIIYGEVVTLGAGLNEGSQFDLGEQLPLKRRKETTFAVGLGFRFRGGVK